jgi:hypothetical protein
MQAYIENGEHYYVGKWRANEMCELMKYVALITNLKIY